MKCLKCDKECKAINYLHLKKCSGISVKEYLIEFPSSKLVDDDVAKTYGRKGIENNNFKHGNYFTPKFCASCNSKLAIINKSGYCVRCYAKNHKNSFSGKSHSLETKEKMRYAHLTRDPKTYKGGVGNRTFEDMSQSAKKAFLNEDSDKRRIRLNNFIQAGQRTCRKNKLTKIEQKVLEWIPSEFITKQNSEVAGYFVDILINNFVIECYGDYWHCNPEIYPDDFYNKSLRLTSKEKQLKDLARLKKIEEAGYKTIILWEKEIYDQPSETKQKLLNFIQYENDGKK